jgi:hypothetical protein
MWAVSPEGQIRHSDPGITIPNLLPHTFGARDLIQRCFAIPVWGAVIPVGLRRG